MLKINVLLENYSIENRFKPRHGLSILIDYNGSNILLDVGPDDKFIENANKMNKDLTKITSLFLSHNHIDHTGGINEFIKVNNKANIYLMDDIDSKYYLKLLFFNIPIGLKLNKENRSRIIQTSDDVIIDDKIYFLKNTVSQYLKPTFNKKLYKKDKNKIIHDTFDHEGILVLEDNNELLIFNSCSHNGILNIIETVKSKIPGKRIRSYVGGLHLFNPATKIHESKEYLDYLIKELTKMNIIIYTGHCTGKFALDYMRGKLGEKIQEINTGMELSV
ncbi:MAG: MBL fold metallo-hydrolase [Spirochaetes bacterium]|nr:MBL fold metallo-hydrolase [Spirochaetota bacterium]